MRLGTFSVRSAVAAGLVVTSLIATAKATPVTILFSFTSDPTLGLPQQGTVSGQINGLDSDGANQQASSVIIQSIPAGTPNDTTLSVPITINFPTDPKWNVTSDRNQFTLVGGVVTDANFLAQEFSSADFGNGYISLNGLESGTNSFTLNYLSDNNGILNLNGLDPASGVTFTNAAASTTPEPASFALLGLGSIVALRRQRKASR